MIYSFNQSYNSATPPEEGNGSGISLTKNPSFNLSLVDKYGLSVNSASQYGGQNSLSYNVSVQYPNNVYAPNNGLNYETGLKNPSYVFDYSKNVDAFNGSPQREYKLTFQVNEQSPVSSSSGRYLIYHNESQISGVSGVIDGTLQIGGIRNSTGQIDINLSMLSNPFYKTNKFEIYTGSVSNFTVQTGTNGNLLKSISVFEQKANYTLSIRDGEQPANDSYYFYKILPYDDFGSGILYSSPPISGLMYAVSQPAFLVNNMTGKSVVLINGGAYSIQTFHSGQITGSSYNVVDSVLNVSGNIVSGQWYNPDAGDDFEQNVTYPFRTIKYLAQTTDATGNVSSREILITDNSRSQTGVSMTGLVYSEYAISDSNQSSQFMVSGSGYSNGSGSILLMARVNYPTGTYKLLRTLL